MKKYHKTIKKEIMLIINCQQENFMNTKFYGNIFPDNRDKKKNGQKYIHYWKKMIISCEKIKLDSIKSV